MVPATPKKNMESDLFEKQDNIMIHNSSAECESIIEEEDLDKLLDPKNVPNKSQLPSNGLQNKVKQKSGSDSSVLDIKNTSVKLLKKTQDIFELQEFVKI